MKTQFFVKIIVFYRLKLKKLGHAQCLGLNGGDFVIFKNKV
jgi:hypothetical protein